MIKLPTLYCKTSTGAIQFWSIEATTQIGQMTEEEYAPEWGLIVTRYGQLGTDKPQVANETIFKGKNLGKSNATTPKTQAEFMAQAAWTKQKKSGYVESVEAAQAGEVDKLIQGGVEPMLAHSYADLVYDDRPGHEGEPPRFDKTSDAKKMPFPCYVQPKLDGIRCIAMLRNGKCTLWTRTRKPILSCPHVASAVELMFGSLQVDLTLDGELYNQDLKSDFETIVSAVRKGEPTDECRRLIQYHVYDLVSDAMYAERLGFLTGRMEGWPEGVARLVETKVANDEPQVIQLFEGFRSSGYEGAMLRDPQGQYEGKRSASLLKFKEFRDAEFEIIGFTEGKGKLAGRLGTWICRTKAGAEFECSMNGSHEYLKELFRDGQSYVGKLLTVRFQDYTGANRVPRIPKGHSVRDYE